MLEQRKEQARYLNKNEADGQSDEAGDDKHRQEKLIEKMPIELQELMQKSNDDSIYSLMGLSRADFLKYRAEVKFLKSHGMKT